MDSSAGEENHENIPLDGGRAQYNGGKPGYFLSKAKITVAFVIVLLLIVIIVILAVFLCLASQRKAKGDELGQTNETSPTQVGTTPAPHTSMAPTTKGTGRWWNPRLPPYIVPSHYDLFLNITVDQLHFNGHVFINVDVKKSTDVIIVHNNGLFISQVEVYSMEKKAMMPVAKSFIFRKYLYYVIQMESSLQPGKYAIKLQFDGLFHSYVGLYRQTYKRSNGQKVYFAATQFEDLEARRAFPCFDEPAMKATFNVTIAHRPDYVALSNMPIYKTRVVRNQRVNYYSKSVLMPTYLLAFVVGDFNSTELLSSNDIKMRYYSRPSFVYKLEYAKSVGGRIMTYFEKLFDLKYPLPKEDMVAIPNFAYGGMENWGLILYKDDILLWDPKESTEQEKLLAVQVITHELAHMWFGNIVTLNWWNDIWLNEGFAKIFEEYGVGHVEPDWKDVPLWIDKGMFASMTYDVQAQSNPVSEDLARTISTTDIDSVIYYDKAMCILRMLKSIVGEKTWIDGLKVYLKEHAYANVVTDDVWKALTKESCSRGKCMDIKQVMDPWTLQTGFPLVTFKKKNATHYTVIQSHYKRNETYRKSPFGYKWVIPLSYTIKDKGRRFTWMNMTSATIEWDGKGWIKANTDHYGYYVTSYDESNWLALAEQLKQNHTVFSPSGRAGMIMDLYEFLRGKVNYSTVFAMAEYMTNETEYIPWKMFLDGVYRILDRLTRTSPAYRYLMKYLVFLGKKQYERLGFQDTGTGVDKVARGLFLKLFCTANVKTCTTKAHQLYKAWMENPDKNAIPPNLRKEVYYFGVAEGGLEEWDFLYKQYNKTQNRAIKDAILFGLAGSKEPWIIERYLSYLSDSWRFDTRGKSTALRYITDYNPIGNQIAWGFLRANWETAPSFDHVMFTARQVVPQFNTEYRLQEMLLFKDKLAIKVGAEKISRQFQLWKQIVESRIKWLQDNEKEIEKAVQDLLVKNNIL